MKKNNMMEIITNKVEEVTKEFVIFCSEEEITIEELKIFLYSMLEQVYKEGVKDGIEELVKKIISSLNKI